MRAALAVSAAAFALAGSGAAFAGDCTAPVGNVVHCNGDFTDTINFAVDDLTLVVGDEAPSTITPADGSPGILADWAGAIGVTNFADITTYAADGIDAVGSGDIALENSGAIDAEAFGQSIGIYAYSDGGDVTVVNGGAVSAYSYAGLADAIFASGINVDVSNSADGTLDANGVDWAAGIEAQGSDSVGVSNAGSIGVQTYGVGEAFGIYAGGGAGGATVDNAGTIQVQGYDVATAIYATAGGDIDVSNSGDVIAGYVADYNGNTYASSYASGILALSGTDGAAISVDNSGLAYAASFSGSSGIEARSLGMGGSAIIDNSGDVFAATLAYGAVSTGIAASADGDAIVDNSGSVASYSDGVSEGIVALSFNGDASIANSGDVTAYSSAFNYYASYGLVAGSLNGGASVDNSGSVDVETLFLGAGIDASGLEDVSVVNSGDVSVDAWRQFGIRAISGDGDVSVESTGSIAASYSHFDFVGRSYGILASSSAGDVSVDSSGDIVSSTTGQSIGIFAGAAQGDASVSSEGDIQAQGLVGVGIGIYATAIGVDIASSGDIDVNGYGYAAGILANGVEQADIAVSGGDIVSTAVGDAVGISAYSAYGDATIQSGASVQAYSMYGSTINLLAIAPGGNAVVGNSGDVGFVATPRGATGLHAQGATATVVNSGNVQLKDGTAEGLRAIGDSEANVENSGSVSVEGVFGAYAIDASSSGATTAVNSGDILASTRGYLAVGILARGDTVAIDNSGDIETVVETGYSGGNVGIVAQAYGDVALDNSGSISSSMPGGAIAAYLYSTTGSITIANTGTIHGAIITSGGDDSFSNGPGGNWLVGNGATTFGDGDDAVGNGAGGTIHLANGGIYLGSSGAAGNSFENQGTLLTSGYGLIDMGTGPTALVPSLNPLAFINDGIIDFVDGAPDDMLVIVGDLDGDGAINLDVNLLNGASDLLYVDGSVVDGTTQAINLLVDGTPWIPGSDSVPVVEVSGNVAANAFVGGQVLNVDPGNFVNLGVAVSTSSLGGLNVVSANVSVDGLNDTGVLAASIASGAHSLINSSIGTLRQRMGVAPQAVEGQAGLSPWVRVFTDKGDVDPHASGFGSGGDFGFEQENRGREFGMGFGFGNGFSLGLMAGTADGTQRLTGAEGSDRLKLHSSGLYATWMGPSVYVDASVRWMDFDARLLSAVGEQDTSGNATAFNLEAGYTGWTMAGMNVVPQVQYTRSQIDNIDVVQGSQVGFAAAGGASERGRLGVAIDRSFATAGGMTWTPYGALSAVREFDGESTFVVADAFEGGTDIEGTSSLVELGVGAQKGGFSATAGVNWTDGGALDSFVGGQLLLRYTW